MKKLFFAIFLFVVSASYANAELVIDTTGFGGINGTPYYTSQGRYNPGFSLADQFVGTGYGSFVPEAGQNSLPGNRSAIFIQNMSLGAGSNSIFQDYPELIGENFTQRGVSQGETYFKYFSNDQTFGIFNTICGTPCGDQPGSTRFIRVYADPLSTTLSYSNGKVNIAGKSFCTYVTDAYLEGPFLGQGTKGVIKMLATPTNNSCLERSGLQLLNFDNANPAPGPEPFQPLQQNIAGLVCDTYYLPEMSTVSWYSDFGSLANRDIFRENGSLIQTGTGSSTQNLDVMAIIGASSGSTLPLGSLSFTGSAYADIADLGPDGKLPAIYSWLKRGGSIAGWNVIQINGVNTGGFFGKYGIFEGKSTDGITNQKIMYSSGGIAEANLFNNKVGTTWQVFGPVSGFSGVRVGYAPYTQRKSCQLPGINSCEWKIEGGKNLCGPVISQNFQVGICSVAGSGSLYGSGSCVPVVNSSGQVVDAGILPGEGTTITLPDGTTKLVRISADKINILFDCPNSQDQPWYKYIFSCAAEVIGNISNKVTGSTNSVISAQVGTYSNERLYTGSFSGLIQNFGNGQNPLVGTGAKTNTGALLLAIKGKLDTVGQPGPEIWQKMFTGGVAIGLLLMILSILAMIISSIKDRGSNINKK